MSGEASAQALSALGKSLDVTAHNIANVSTPGFQPARAVLADGPDGQGVRLAAVERSGAAQAQGPRGEAGSGMPTVNTANGVDVAEEMVGLMTTGRAFEANAVAFRAAEETTGHLLDIVV